MMRLLSLLHFKRGNSLFIKLLAGFLLIILLLVSFNFFSFRFFEDNIRKEIIRLNSGELNNTVENYENHIHIIDNLMSKYFFDLRIDLLKNQLEIVSDFELINQLSDELKSLVPNELLFLDNIMVYFKNNSLLLDTSGITSAADFFTLRYQNNQYGPYFWEEQFKQKYRLRIFPISDFINKNDYTAPVKQDLLPIVFKNQIDDRMYIVAFVESQKLFNTLHFSTSDRFYIINDEGEPLFASSDLPIDIRAELLQQNEGVIEQNQNYFFYIKSPAFGLTYISVVPNERIANEVSQLNVVLIVFLTLAVIISLVISVVLSMKFNNPIQKIIKGIQSLDPDISLSTNIREYALINEKINTIIKANLEIHKDLTNKNSLLVNYGWINKVKGIETNGIETQKLTDINKPFFAVLFQIHFTNKVLGKIYVPEQKKVSNYIREFIHVRISERFYDSQIIPLEKDQVLVFLFGRPSSEQVVNELHLFKEIFNQDKKNYYLTIALLPEFMQSDDLTEVYSKLLEMANQRNVTEETQVIRELKPESYEIFFSLSQDQEFVVNLQAGNRSNVMNMIHSALKRMEKKQACVSKYQQFASEIMNKTIKTLVTQNLDFSKLMDNGALYHYLKMCSTPEQYYDFFDHLISRSIELIQEQKQQKEPLIEFIIDYLKEHYREDISLVSVADKLKISSGYLSIYFKEKTGINFSVYLNDVRISKAIELLETTELKIQEVGEAVGYQNVNSFIRMFKKISGKPPSEFRKNSHLKEKLIN